MVPSTYGSIYPRQYIAYRAPPNSGSNGPAIKIDGNLNKYSWLCILLGYPVLGIWYWCSDQTIVQRVLGAKTERAGQNGAIFAGFLKILPLF